MRPGDEFAGRYVLSEVIGAGRSGEVWLAHDTVVGQDVALKPERIEGDRDTAVRRLLAEPRALAKFRDHPHVVTLFDVVTVERDGEETYWFVMEYVPGGGLDRQPPMSAQRAARIGAELADALAALHEAGIVHCDVKPANIGLTRRGTAKLLDFGAAHRTSGTETITSNGPLSFTPDYAAPELARGHLPRPASDVFCLAATLYALVTGAPPRGGESGDGGTDTERLTYWKAEQGVVEMDAEAVGPLYPVLTAMLHRDPRQRPDAAEAGRQLAAVATSGSASGSLATTAQPGGRARWRWPARRPLLATAVGIGAALVLGGLILAPGGGDADRGTDEAGRSSTAEASLIGDPRTADVCALTDPAALGQFGKVRVDVDYGNFDRCDQLVSPDDETRIDVAVQLRPGSRPESSRPTTRIGRIGVLEESPETDECGLLLYDSAADGDADGTLVGIRVDVGDGSVTGGNATLCTVAHTAARSAAEVLNAGALPRRSPAYPDNSLAWADACALLDAKALSDAVPGIEPDTPETGVANWNCEWFSTVDDLEAEVSFFRDQPKSAKDRKVVRLGDYRALVEPEGDGDDTCTVFLEYRRYSGQGARTAAEMVRLRVGGERPMDDLCTMVTDLATSAATKLPER